MNRLDAIRKRVEAAREGPWRVNESGMGWKLRGKNGEWIASIAFDMEAESAFIAHSREDIELLLEVAEAARRAGVLARHGPECLPLERDRCECGIDAINRVIAKLDEVEAS